MTWLADELAVIIDRLYGGVCYAGIDTDPELKYPKGAGRVAFSNQKSYIAAISARFVQLQLGDIDKRVSYIILWIAYVKVGADSFYLSHVIQTGAFSLFQNFLNSCFVKLIWLYQAEKFIEADLVTFAVVQSRSIYSSDFSILVFSYLLLLRLFLLLLKFSVLALLIYLVHVSMSILFLGWSQAICAWWSVVWWVWRWTLQSKVCSLLLC